MLSLQRTLLALICSYTLLGLLNVLTTVQGYALGQSKYGRIEMFPYQVMLIGKQLWRKRILCGGTLLDQRWILTAGHCTMGVTHFDIYLGALTIEDGEETGRLVLRSTKFIVHEAFNPQTAANDIALVKLPIDVPFTARIQPATLPYHNRHDQLVGAKVVATGWGATTDRSSSDPMQYTELRVISNEECANEFDVVTSGVICAKGLREETVCSGDSGGPLVLKNTQTVVGVTSFGPADGCETNIPGGFTRVSYYLHWIETKIGNVAARAQQQKLQQYQRNTYAAQQQVEQQQQQQQQQQQYIAQAPAQQSYLVNDNAL